MKKRFTKAAVTVALMILGLCPPVGARSRNWLEGHPNEHNLLASIRSFSRTVMIVRHPVMGFSLVWLPSRNQSRTTNRQPSLSTTDAKPETNRE